MAKKKTKQKSIIQEMSEYLDDKMSRVTSFDESVATLNRSLNHIDEHATS
jgi:hypothetical protein